MLTLTVPGIEMYDEDRCEFIYTHDQPLRLEHSLISISKWESKWKKIFFDAMSEGIKGEEFIDYVRCMTLNQVKDDRTYYSLTNDNVQAIYSYMSDSMTATTIKDKPGKKKGRKLKLSSEVIYAQMAILGIPFEADKWHINRLLTLIRVCDELNTPGEKMSKSDQYAFMRAQNNARRAAHHTKG